MPTVLAFGMELFGRSIAVFVPPRRGRRLIPPETLIAFVLASPLLAVLLVRKATIGSWSIRLHIVAGALLYAAAIALALHATFNGLFARAPEGARRHPLRFPAYWVTAELLVVAITHLFAPVFAWMDLTVDPTRRIVQATVIISFYLAAAFLFKGATERIAHEQNRALTERASALDARFQALQARTNPHFLFNTLNSIMSLIAKDPEQAEQVLGRLSTLMRYSIEGADRSHVSLREELEAVRDYLAIEQVRFGDRLRVTVDVGDEVNLAARVPPMVLQPLVENAILHGVARSVEGGRVRVTAANGAGDLVELIVDDDGAPADASPHVGTKTALANLHERLRLLYGGQASLAVGERPGGGFRARITIPIRSLS
jgi:two-component system sensor histidine kinase AlgZ